MSAVLLLAAIAVLVLPLSRGPTPRHSATGAGGPDPTVAVRPGGHAGAGGVPGGALRSRAAPALAAAATGVAALAAFGPVRGVVAAAVVVPVTLTGLRALRSRPVPVRVDRSLALALDLCAAALRAGRTPADALAAAAPAAEPASRDALLRVAGLLRLGAEPRRAWSVLAPDGPLGAVAATAARSATSGIRAAAAFERLAADIRDECAARATMRAHRAGIVAMAPLGACFLPSFVCLGIVPVVVGIARTSLGVLR